MTYRFKEQGFSTRPGYAPVTPYQKAAEVWDERIGSARVQAKNWRLIAFALIAVVILLAGMLTKVAGQSSVQPYIIKVGDRGNVVSVEALTGKQEAPDAAMIRYFLSDIVTNMRTMPLDPVVARNNWLRVYNFLSTEAQTHMNEIAQENDPFADLGERTRSINIESIVSLSENTRQIRWAESTFAASGAFIITEIYTGIFTFAVEPPQSQARLQVNPLGLVITHFDIGKDASS
tara:strand:- start:1315 stop:2013 length:699 start_codon:yes stop_codon:yes gene_type:complete